MAGINPDVLRNVLRRQHVVRDGRWRVGVLEMIQLLARDFFGDGKTAMILQRRCAERAVAAGAGQYDTDRLLGAFFRQRHQEAVDRGPLTGRLLGLADRKTAAMDRGDHRRWTKIDRTALDGLAVADAGDHGSARILQDFAQPRLVQRLMMLKRQYDSLIRLNGELGKEALDTVQGSRRGTHPHDQRGPDLALSFDRLVADFVHVLASFHWLAGRTAPPKHIAEMDVIPIDGRQKCLEPIVARGRLSPHADLPILNPRKNRGCAARAGSATVRG